MIDDEVGEVPPYIKISLRTQLKYVDGKWIRIGPNQASLKQERQDHTGKQVVEAN